MKTYKDLFLGNIDISLKTAVTILSSYPASAAAFLKLSNAVKAAEQRRKKNADGNAQIPPLMIVSTTEACNLACAGCYSCAHKREESDELSSERAHEVLDEASDLGVSIVMLAGGEPLLSRGWLDALARHDEMVGIVFTNGTLFDAERVNWFSDNRHIIPTFSLEGDKTATDTRRGDGVFDTVNTAMLELKNNGIPFGVSITATAENIDSVLTDEFVEEYIAKGARLFVFVEYVPVEKGSEMKVLSGADKVRLSEFSRSRSKKLPAVFIPFPGNEDQYGGCLAAGRGFVYISSSGNVEPCPFAPFSDTNLKTNTLKQALQSKLLSNVRDNNHLLKEGDGGCALWHNREWLADLQDKTHATV